MDEKIVKKFWSSINKSDNDCWNWTGTINKYKTPIILTTNPRKEYQSRRLSLLLHDKDIAKNENVFASVCKNNLCVNPDHLICGEAGRFWSKIQKLSEEQGGCWIWTACQNKQGYGKFRCRRNGKHIDIMAHQYSWQLYTGKEIIPKGHGIVLCHKCDHPYCVNPNHLFLGTYQDNSDDMTYKNRQAKGSKQGSSKLTEEQVREIRNSYPKIKGPQLAKIYGVKHPVIYGILHRKSWKHI